MDSGEELVLAEAASHPWHTARQADNAGECHGDVDGASAGYFLRISAVWYADASGVTETTVMNCDHFSVRYASS